MGSAAPGTGAREADASAIAHDLANVIGVMVASCAMLDDDLAALPVDHPARDRAGHLALAIDRAGELCARLRPVATPRAARPQGYDLATVVREACDLVGPTLPRARLACAVEADLPVDGAALDAVQLVLNLALNADEAGSGAVRITTDRWIADRGAPLLGRLVPGRPYARLRVADDGPGLPARARTLFDRGVSGSGGAGRGMGLATVAAIAERAGGAILAGASPSGGALIEVCLPLTQKRPDLRGACVLIVAGAAGPTARVADALEAAGAEPSVCLDPCDAVASVAEDHGAWDAVVVAGPVRMRGRASLITRLREADQAVPVLSVGGEVLCPAGVFALAADADGGAVLDALARAMAHTPELAAERSS